MSERSVVPYPVPELPDSPEECKEVVGKALQEGHDRMCRIEKRQEEIIKKQDEIEKALTENTRITAENAKKADLVYDALMTMRGGVKTFSLVGRFVRWAAGIAVAIWSALMIFDGKSPF